MSFLSKRFFKIDDAINEYVYLFPNELSRSVMTITLGKDSQTSQG